MRELRSPAKLNTNPASGLPAYTQSLMQRPPDTLKSQPAGGNAHAHTLLSAEAPRPIIQKSRYSLSSDPNYTSSHGSPPRGGGAGAGGSGGGRGRGSAWQSVWLPAGAESNQTLSSAPLRSVLKYLTLGTKISNFITNLATRVSSHPAPL